VEFRHTATPVTRSLNSRSVIFPCSSTASQTQLKQLQRANSVSALVQRRVFAIEPATHLALGRRSLVPDPRDQVVDAFLRLNVAEVEAQ